MNKNFENYFKRFNEVVSTVEVYCDEDMSDVRKVLDILENNPTENDIAQSLIVLQEKNDKLYEKHGANECILDLQVCINKLRNYADIVDTKEIIIKAPDGYFVQ